MTGRTRAATAACAGGIIVLAAGTLWLAAKPDGTLSRWSAVAGVLSALFTILAFVAALIPLWRSREPKSEERDNTRARPAGDVVTQHINNQGQGTVNVLGTGIQIVGDGHQPPKPGQ